MARYFKRKRFCRFTAEGVEEKPEDKKEETSDNKQEN